jgi:lecithin-cholesterol acyltransferase
MLLLWLLGRLSLSLKPIVILPPLYGTNLFVNFSHADLHWYCPESATNELFWISPRYIVPPEHNCLLQLLTVFWNNATNDYSDRPNTTVFTERFGETDTIRCVDSGFFGYHFIESFASLIATFRSHGWQAGVDLFAAPYDWRLAPTGLGRFWGDLQGLIERASSLNGGAKVTLFGFSCGGFTTQRFLADHVTVTWKRAHLDRAVFLAPSFGGTGDSFYALWLKRLPILPWLPSQDLSEMVESLPVVISHLPNEHIFGDTDIIRSPFDDTYTAADLPKLLLDNAKVRPRNLPIFERARKTAGLVPSGPDIPTCVVYNSGVQTSFRWHFKKGWDRAPTPVKADGDGTILAKSLEWACRNWSVAGGPIVCVDLYRDNVAFEHIRLTSNPYVLELLVNVSVDPSWIAATGRKLVRAPYVVLKNSTYTIRNDIRKEKVLFRADF